MVTTRIWEICFAVSLAGCGGNALNIGSAEGGTAPNASSSPVWNGYIENAQLQDGSNRLTMTLSVAKDGVATGTLLLGDGSLLRPATDPNTGYPLGVQFPLPGGPLGFFEGFAYPIEDGRSSGSTLTFRAAEFDLWSQWCTLQTTTYLFPGSESTDGGGGVYQCVPNLSFSGNPATGCSVADPATGNPMPIDCGKFELCQNSPCDCSATGCLEKSSTDQLYLDLDLMIVGAKADGTISGGLGVHSVHFVRAP